MPDTAPLPDDIAALKALLLQRDSEVQQLRSAVSTLEQALNVRTLEIEQLKLQIAKLKRMHFGRKSEKIDRKIEQLETRLEDLIAEDGASEQELSATAAPASTGPAHVQTRRYRRLHRQASARTRRHHRAYKQQNLLPAVRWRAVARVAGTTAENHRFITWRSRPPANQRGKCQ